MFGRLIVALLVIGAAAVVTMERDTAEVADMTATLAESKYTDAEERAQLFERRAKSAEARLAELDAKTAWLERELAATTLEKERALLPLELRTKAASVRGTLDLQQVLKVARENIPMTSPCFARAPRGPEITMKWVINANGHVVSVVNGEVPEGYDDVAACLATEIATWSFPHAKDAKEGLTLAQLTWLTSSAIER